MVLLDTNVVSELMRPRPHAGVRAWLASQPGAEVFLPVIVEAELRYGAAILPPGRRRERLAEQIARMLQDDFCGRILPFDCDAAQSYATLAASRRAGGDPIRSMDGQIAAIARCRGAALATRNVRDFRNCGVEVINPWRERDS